MSRRKIMSVLAIAGAAAASCGHFKAETAAADPRCAGFVTSGAGVEEIRILEQAGAASNVNGLTREQAELMFWPGYVSVGQDGKVMTREAILATWTPVPWASRFDIQELDIRAHCDTAIAVGLSAALWKGAPAETKPVHLRWLNVWTKSNGEWRLSATQFTRF